MGLAAEWARYAQDKASTCLLLGDFPSFPPKHKLCLHGTPQSTCTFRSIPGRGQLAREALHKEPFFPSYALLLPYSRTVIFGGRSVQTPVRAAACLMLILRVGYIKYTLPLRACTDLTGA